MVLLHQGSTAAQNGKKTSFIFQSFPSNDHLIGLKTQILPLNVYASGLEVLDDVFVVLRWFESQPETQTGSYIYQSRGYSNHSRKTLPLIHVIIYRAVENTSQSW